MSVFWDFSLISMLKRSISFSNFNRTMEPDQSNLIHNFEKTLDSEAFAGFAAAKSMKIVQDHIATGSLGTGVFKNNANVMFAVQAIAAELAGINVFLFFSSFSFLGC